MKKLFLAGLILCMLLFVACGNQPDPTEPADQPTQNMIEDAQPTQEDATEAEQEIRGTIDGNTYRNEFIGLTIELDDSWTFYSDEQIAALYGLTVDRAGEDWANLIANSPIVYDMYAVAANQVDNININLEKSNALLLENFDISENFEKWSSTNKAAYENMGYSEIEMKIGTTEIDGQIFESMDVTASVGALQLHQTIIGFVCEDYIVSVSFTAMGESSIDDMLSCVSLLDGVRVL